MGKYKDIAGQRFGRLVAIEVCGKNKQGAYLWRCVCDCGKEAIAIGTKLRYGIATSCGCHIKHGKTGSKEYYAWQAAKTRCYDTGNKDYAEWGGRGITVCDRWLDSFEAFYADMGDAPSKEYSLGRIDNNGPYAPDNCEWQTQGTQSNNKRCTQWINYQGRSQPLSVWAKEVGIKRDVLYKRLRLGWPIEQALAL